MYMCGSCNHPVVFHEATPPKEPCYLCPRGKCKVSRCTCAHYDGIQLSSKPHAVHKLETLQWGNWGTVLFTNTEEWTSVSTPTPVIERAQRRITW